MELFITKIKEKFGDAFDYSKVVYKDRMTPVLLICKKHNIEFSKPPTKLLYRDTVGCKTCVTDNKKQLFRKSIDTFILEANTKHKYKFNYSKVMYVNSETPITIICPIHKEFETSPYQHLNSDTGCQKCSGCYRRTLKDFIEEAIKIHGDAYDYSKAIYINTHTNVIIYCKKHNLEYNQTPSMHLNGSRCKLCAYECGSEKRRYTTLEFINMAKEVHPYNLDDYSSVEYKDMSTNINMICKIHGTYTQRPMDHVRGHRCSKCGKDKLSLQYRLPLEEFIKRSNEVHKNFYNYSKVIYVNTDTKVDIICPKHGIFQQTPHNHMNGSTCRKCTMNGCSKVQLAWLNFLSNELHLYIQHASNDGEYKIKNSKCKADGYCKSINTIFEFHGCYYHGCTKCKFKPDDINKKCNKTYKELYEKTQKKKELCIKEGYNYIELWGCEWTKMKKSDELIETYIKNIKSILPISSTLSIL